MLAVIIGSNVFMIFEISILSTFPKELIIMLIPRVSIPAAFSK
jgi:hypothetical protein